MSWTDEQLREFNTLSDRLLADQQARQPPANGHRELPANVHPLRTPSPPANAKLDQLIDALRSYLHLDDTGHVLFTLAVTIGAKLDGPRCGECSSDPPPAARPRTYTWSRIWLTSAWTN